MVTKSDNEDTADENDQTAALKGKDGQPLSDEEAAQIRDLKQTDRKVRNHEMAHMAAGAGLVKGGASYSYKKGPDGNLYAVGGEVSIDTSEGKTPQETITRMQQVRAAALAPADPSPQDRAVAAAAAAKASQAAAELASQKTTKAQNAVDNDVQPQDTPEKTGMQVYNRAMSPEKPNGKTIDIAL